MSTKFYNIFNLKSVPRFQQHNSIAKIQIINKILPSFPRIDFVSLLWYNLYYYVLAVHGKENLHFVIREKERSI